MTLKFKVICNSYSVGFKSYCAGKVLHMARLIYQQTDTADNHSSTSPFIELCPPFFNWVGQMSPINQDLGQSLEIVCIN